MPRRTKRPNRRTPPRQPLPVQAFTHGAAFSGGTTVKLDVRPDTGGDGVHVIAHVSSGIITIVEEFSREVESRPLFPVGAGILPTPGLEDTQSILAIDEPGETVTLAVLGATLPTKVVGVVVVRETVQDEAKVLKWSQPLQKLFPGQLPR